MGLDFSGIADQHGAAVYLIDDGTTIGGRRMESLANDLQKLTQNQVVHMSGTSDEARKIIDFYDLQSTECILIIRDNDQIHHMWQHGDHATAEMIAQSVNQIG